MKHNHTIRFFTPLVIGISLAVPITSYSLPTTYDLATGVLHLPAVEVPNSATGKTEVFQADLVWKTDNSESLFELVSRQDTTFSAGKPENAAYDLDTNTIKVPLVEVQGNDGTQFYTGEMQLISSDPLRFAVTEVREIDGALIDSLPPDPGEVGQATLAGVDSDSDGVRDDVQRHITLNYPNPEDAPLRDALIQYAVNQQQFLRDADNPEQTLANARVRDKYVDCVMYLNPDEGLAIIEDMELEFANTEDRRQVYVKADDHLGGQVFSLTPRAELASLCGSVPEKLRNKTLRDGNRRLPEPICSSTYIAFVNGIMTNEEPAARASLWELEATLQDRLPATINPKYVLVYNPTGRWGLGLITDTWEVGTQLLGIESKDVAAHVALYKDWLEHDKRVIVVAHSQGNLHANQSYDKLLEENVENLSSNFRIVSVATPDSRVVTPPYHYVTLVDDKVVGKNTLFSLNPGLPGWAKNDWYCVSWKQGECNNNPKPKRSLKEKFLNHNFVDSYLHGNRTGKWIIDEVVASIDATQTQAACSPIYGVQDSGLNDSQLFKIDSEMFHVTPLGQLHEKYNLEALDINSQGDLYAVSSDSDEPDDTVNPGYLYKVNTKTGDLQAIGSLGLENFDVDSISFDSQDTLWGWSKSQGAVEIDTSTGTATLQDTSNLQAVEDMSWNGDDLFYLTEGTELLFYDGVNPPQPVCSDLPGGKPEGLEFVSEDRMLLGVHGQKSIYVMKIDDQGCKKVGEIPTPYNDIEAMAWQFEGILEP